MKFNRTVAAGSIIALALAGAAPALAQMEPSAFTPETVPPDAPFGELPVDPMTVDLAAIGDLLAALTPEQALELQQRCVVITENADNYSAEAVALCTAVLEATAM